MGPGHQAASSAHPTSPCCQGTLSLLGAADKGDAKQSLYAEGEPKERRENILQGLTTGIWLGRVAPSWEFP